MFCNQCEQTTRGTGCTVSGVWGYWKYASPTRIAFVNYPEYVLAEDLDQPINPAIEVSVLPWGPDSGEELRNYDAILFFGMGTNISERQRAILDSLEKPIYLTSTPNNETAKNTMTPEQRKVIADYMRNGGKDNFRNMLNYIRRELDGKRLRAGKILFAYRDGLPTAGLLYLPRGDTVMITDEYTPLDYRPGGLGTAMIAQAVQLFGRQGMQLLFLQASSPDGKRFCRECGFVPVPIAPVWWAVKGGLPDWMTGGKDS